MLFSALGTVSMTTTNSFWGRTCIKCYRECNWKQVKCWERANFRSSQQPSSSGVPCRQGSYFTAASTHYHCYPPQSVKNSPICYNSVNPQSSTSHPAKPLATNVTSAFPVSPSLPTTDRLCRSTPAVISLNGWTAAFMVMWKMKWTEKMYLYMVAVTNTKKHSVKMTYRRQWFNYDWKIRQPIQPAGISL